MNRNSFSKKFRRTAGKNLNEQPSGHSIFIEVSLGESPVALVELPLTTIQYKSVQFGENLVLRNNSGCTQGVFIDGSRVTENLIEKYIDDNFKISYYVDSRVV